MFNLVGFDFDPGGADARFGDDVVSKEEVVPILDLFEDFVIARNIGE